MMRDEIEKMQAGDELDELVEIYVFGRPVVALSNASRCPYCGQEMRYCGSRSRCFHCNDWRYSSIKEYSIDISAAWEVVEKANIVCISRASSTDTEEDDEWAAWCDDRSMAYADSVPLAICRAALLAKAGEG